MQHSENMIQIILAAIGGALGWFFGGFDGFWYTLVVLVIVDYLSGVMCAVIEKKLSSEFGFRGICKKVAIFLLVGVGNVLDQRILGSGNALRTTVIFFYCANEGMILSRLVDTFSSRVLYPMLPLSGNHSIAVVLSWEEDLH